MSVTDRQRKTDELFQESTPILTVAHVRFNIIYLGPEEASALHPFMRIHLWMRIHNKWTRMHKYACLLGLVSSHLCKHARESTCGDKFSSSPGGRGAKRTASNYECAFMEPRRIFSLTCRPRSQVQATQLSGKATSLKAVVPMSGSYAPKTHPPRTSPVPSRYTITGLRSDGKHAGKGNQARDVFGAIYGGDLWRLRRGTCVASP